MRSTAFTSGAGVLVGSGAVVGVGAGPTFGGGDVGADVGVSGSDADSQANTKNIVDSAAIATLAMLLVNVLRIGVFVEFIGRGCRWIVSCGHCLERRFGG